MTDRPITTDSIRSLRLLGVTGRIVGRFGRALGGAVLAFLLTWGLHGADYYVDQTAGSDGNNGTSPTSAWKNCPGMSAYSGSGSIRPGDTVFFDRGDTWVVTGGQGIHLVGGVTYVGNSWGAGTLATIRAGGDLDAGVVRFRDHATIPTVFQGFDVDANRKVCTGIDINHRYGSLMNGATKRVKDCNVHNTWSQQALGQYKYGIAISNHGGASTYAENVELLDTAVHDTSRDAIVLYPGDENGDCRIKNILVRGCEAYNTGQDPDYCCGGGIVVKGYVQDAFIEYNYVHDTKGAALFINSNESRHYGVGPTNIHLAYNIVTCRVVHGAIRIYDGGSGNDPKDLKIYGNVIYDSTAGAGFLIDTDLGNTLKLLVYNNTFYNAPVVIRNSSAVVTTFEFKNNLLFHPGGVPLTDSQGKITAHSNNLYFRPSGTVVVSSGGQNYSASTLASYESSGLAVDPQLRNPAALPSGFVVGEGGVRAPDTDGLGPLAGSPVLNRGASLPAAYGGSINSVIRPAGTGWDLGAYELPSGQKPVAPENLRIIQVQP